MNIAYALLVSSFFLMSSNAHAARLKDIAAVKGVRENILIGYGIVVGLKGTGDSSADITGQSLSRLFNKLGLEAGSAIKSKNAAAVIVTAKLPPFSRAGNLIDITVSSIGDATSLEGGMLLVTPLRAGDQNIYAVAQGPVSLGSNADGAKVFPTVGRVVSGASIEKDIDSNFQGKKSFRLSLHMPDFTTAARMVATINSELGGKYANARDSATVDVMVPFNYDGNAVELLATLENIKVNVDTKSKVVLNERTGTIVMGGNIQISPVAIAHGELSIEVKEEAGAAAGGAGAKKGKGNRLLEIKNTTNVGDLVKALNALGVQPRDLTAIFQSLKQMGALQADLEVM